MYLKFQRINKIEQIFVVIAGLSILPPIYEKLSSGPETIRKGGQAMEKVYRIALLRSLLKAGLITMQEYAALAA